MVEPATVTTPSSLMVMAPLPVLLGEEAPRPTRRLPPTLMVAGRMMPSPPTVTAPSLKMGPALTLRAMIMSPVLVTRPPSATERRPTPSTPTSMEPVAARVERSTGKIRVWPETVTVFLS